MEPARAETRHTHRSAWERSQGTQHIQGLLTDEVLGDRKHLGVLSFENTILWPGKKRVRGGGVRFFL